MARELIMTAATVEAAKAKILDVFDVPAEAVEFEVLEEGQKKAFGLFGGADAKVRGTMTDTAIEAAKRFLAKVLTQMGAKDVTVTDREEDGVCVLSVEGDDLGFVIGRRGETLDALQYLTGLVANRAEVGARRVTVDIGNYREKREQTLKELANKIANQVARSGRKSSLEPMNPYERRIIHTAVQNVEGVVSFSVGSDTARHVVIAPSDDNPNKQNRPARRPRGGRGRRDNDTPRAPRESRVGADGEIIAVERQIRKFVPRSNPMPTADGATPQKTTSERENTASLYGRIDL